MDDQSLTIIITSQNRNAGIRAAMNCPDGFTLRIEPTKRTTLQSIRLHAMCGDFAKQREWAGAKRTTVDWKRLLVDGHGRATGTGGFPVAPSLDFSGVVTLGELTRDMGIKRMASVIEYTFAYGDEIGVKWSEKVTVPDWYRDRVAA